RLHVDEGGGLVEVPLREAIRTASPHDQPGASGYGIRDLLLDLLALPSADHGTEVDVRPQGVADAERLREGHETVNELVEHTTHDEEALRGRADLAHVQEAGPHRSSGGHVQVDALVHDEGVVASELEVALLELLGAGDRHLPARRLAA